MAKRIALISDNHGYYGEDIMKYLNEVDEVWHAGDIGDYKSITPILEKKPFRAVYGNIDSGKVRTTFPLDLVWTCEGVKVFMTHIGGYPGKYQKRVYDILQREKPQLYICGHSHICKVMFDQTLQVLHMNPGAYGIYGWHTVRTILRFTCINGEIKDAEVVELGSKGKS